MLALEVRWNSKLLSREMGLNKNACSVSARS